MLKMFAICVYTSSQTLPEIRDCRLRLVVTRPRSLQALTSVPGCPSAVDLFTKQNDVIVMSLLSRYSVCWYSVVLDTRLQLLGAKFLIDPKNVSALAGANRLVKNPCRKSGAL